MGIIIPTMVLSSSQRKASEQFIQEKLIADVRDARGNLTAKITTFIQGAHILGISSERTTPLSPEMLLQNAEKFREKYSAFQLQGVGWMDSSFNLQWLDPEPPDIEHLKVLISQDKPFATFQEFDRIKKEILEQRTWSIGGSLLSDKVGMGFTLYEPVFVNGRFQGCYCIIEKNFTFFDVLTRDLQKNYSVQVASNASNHWRRVWFEKSETPLSQRSKLSQDEPIDLENFWQLFIWPKESYIKSLRSPLPNVTLFFGSLTGVLMSIAVYMTQKSRTQSKALLNAEEINRKNRRILQSILTSMGDGVMVADSVGNFILFNPEAEAILGQGATNVTPQQWTKEYGFFLPDMKTPCSPGDFPLIRAMLGEVIKTAELFVRNSARPDGLWLSMSARPLKDVDGVARGGVCVFRDITELKNYEHQLEIAKEEAIAATRSKSEFLANMSHEIRTPMNGVIGTLGLLLNFRLSEQERELAEIARSSAQALMSIINDILDYSKIEAGKMTIEPVPFDLLGVIEEVSGLMAIRAEEKNLELILRFSPEAPRFVIGDTGRIRQILFNLIGNALKFTSQGHILIEIEPRKSKEGILFVNFAVTDTGIGIPEGKHEAIFENFTQADSSTTRKYGGTGLGLSISKKLVELMDGFIGLTSTVGQGSTFWFCLPLSLQEPIPSQAASPAPRDFAGMKILVVHGNEFACRALTDLLHSWNISASSAPSATGAMEALAACQKTTNAFTLVITNDHLPDEEGQNLLSSIRDQFPEVKTMMLVNRNEQQTLSGLPGQPFDALLVRPPKQTQLFETLITVTSKQWEQKSPSVDQRPLKNSTAIQPRILVAEDNSINQRVARLILEELGCTVDVVGNGQEAVHMIEILPYDLVLMDCEMPEVNGFDAAREVRRKSNGNRRIPIVAMTARVSPEDRHLCEEAGMDDFVSKPIEPSTLGAVLRKWIVHYVPPAICDGPLRTPHQTATTTMLDRETISRLQKLAKLKNPALLAELAQTFTKDTEERIAALQKAVEEGNPNELAHIAHTMKGACANLGAKEMAHLCEQLIRVGRCHSVAGTSPIISRLGIIFQQTARELQSYTSSPIG